jgi:hypothetical protein
VLPQWKDAFALAAARAAGPPEIERGRRLAHAVVDWAQARWVQDVRESKRALANGQGSMHGRHRGLST